MKRPLHFHSNSVWPPAILVVLFILSYGLVTACIRLVESAFPGAATAISGAREILNLRAAILGGAAGLYAAYRLWRFHPACNPAYAWWLRLTPWTADKPLPLGPVLLVWQDAVVVGVLVAIAAWHAHINPVLPAAIFGLVYFGGLTLLLAITHRWWSCLLLGFLWPALMLPVFEGFPVVALVAAIILVAWIGHRKSLRAFPWQFQSKPNRPAGSILEMELNVPGLGADSGTPTSANIGWPFTALSPKLQSRPVSVTTSLSLSALFGWWTYCVMIQLHAEPTPGLILIFALPAALVRLVIYGSNVVPPFGLWGRVASGRIVIPGYDKVFLTPLAVVLLAILGVLTVSRSGTWYPVVESGFFALTWLVLLSGGPTLQSWILTGQHRFRVPARLRANRRWLRSV